MLKLEIPELEDALKGEIAETADWAVANIDTSISWPVEYEKYIFEGEEIFIIPLTRNHYPAIAKRCRTETKQHARSMLLRFLSALSWSESAGAIVVSFSDSALPRPTGHHKTFGHAITRDLALVYLPECPDPRQGIALALMREGRGLNHPAYAFLSFYRVLEAALPHGRTRGSWSKANIDNIMDRQGQKALAELKASGIADVSEHLYKSGRMAIAHAQSNPIINPDDAADYERIASELPVMRGLAELAIEDVLGIKTRHTLWNEHLYELAGFKTRLGSAECQRIGSGQAPADGTNIDLPQIDIELRRKKSFEPLCNMHPIYVSQDGRLLQLVYASSDNLVEFGFSLDFADERLCFDWQRDFTCRDDGSVQAAHHAAAMTRFVLEYVGNGELHIYDSDTRDLLSRVDAFLPTNYWANHKALLQQIEHWEAEVTRRENAKVAKS